MIYALIVVANGLCMLAAFYLGYKAGKGENIKESAIEYSPVDLEEIEEDQKLKPIEELMRENGEEN